MLSSWKLPVLTVSAVFGGAAFLCPACGDRAESPPPAPSVSVPAASLTSAAEASDVETVVLDVDGMTCGGCAMATETALSRLAGVRSAEATYNGKTDAGRAVVEYEPSRVTPEEMIEAVEAVGFQPTLRERSGGR